MGREVERRNIKEKKKREEGGEGKTWKVNGRERESRRILSNISILGRNFKEETLHKKRYIPLHTK